MARELTKNAILAKGAGIIFRKGFNNTGLMEILNEAGVPRGSFYFYFKNKEDYGLQIIDFFMKNIRGFAERSVADEKTGLGRLRKFFSGLNSWLGTLDYSCGCPIGNLSQEMGDQSESFRLKLREAYGEMKGFIADCLRDDLESGLAGEGIDPESMSVFLANAWEGALIDMKLQKNAEPLRIFMDTAFDIILKQYY